MSEPFVDTDVIIRFLTGDDPIKQAQAAAFFRAIEDGKLTVRAPVTVIADTVYVLGSPRLYRLPRPQIAAMLSRLVRLPGVRMERRRTVIAALALYGSSTLDFGDCMLVASMRQQGSSVIYSYDEDFERFPPIQRREPAAPERP